MAIINTKSYILGGDMKKLVAVMLSGMMALCLAACGNSADTGKPAASAESDTSVLHSI